MNQQEETEITEITEKGKQKLRGEGGGVSRELRYHRFLLFKPKPMNQQEETEITEITEKAKGCAVMRDA